MMSPYEVASPDDSSEMLLHSGSDEDDEQPLQCSFSQILKGGDVFFSDFLSEPIEFNNNNNITSSLSKSNFTAPGNVTGSQSTAQAFSNLVNSMNLMDSFMEGAMTSSLYPGVEDEEFSTINTKSLQMSF